MLKALPIQAPSSKLIPRWPFRSGRPRVIIRPVSVTIPAPVITPKIPNSGDLESSDGAAAARERACCAGPGRGTTSVEAAIWGLLLTPGADSCDHGKTGTQLGRKL